MTEADLRLMIRETLREALGKASPRRDAPAAPQAEAVRIETDADLQAFLSRLAAPGGIEAVREGRLSFRLAGAGRAATENTVETRQVRIEGVISERRLHGLKRGERVLLAPGAVLTPLARDLARRIGISIEREAQ